MTSWFLCTFDIHYTLYEGSLCPLYDIWTVLFYVIWEFPLICYMRVSIDTLYEIFHCDLYAIWKAALYIICWLSYTLYKTSILLHFLLKLYCHTRGPLKLFPIIYFVRFYVICHTNVSIVLHTLYSRSLCML